MRCLLIDKIITCEKGSKITGIKNVTMSENFLQDHFPGFPVMPGVLQLEAVSQLGSWLIFATTDFKKKAEIVSVKSVKFKEFIVPGDQMRIELELKSQSESSAIFNAKIFVDSKLKTEIKRGQLSYVDVEQLEDPLKTKEHFDFITGNSPMGRYESGKKGGYL
jgi:3-hydroxyacyl-[acyl-carrier-protein] dehydratase